RAPQRSDRTGRAKRPTTRGVNAMHGTLNPPTNNQNGAKTPFYQVVKAQKLWCFDEEIGCTTTTIDGFLTHIMTLLRVIRTMPLSSWSQHRKVR
ncbi:MAG: hypothetical protein ABJO38_14110, partial [Stappiaceae bacterium]